MKKPSFFQIYSPPFFTVNIFSMGSHDEDFNHMMEVAAREIEEYRKRKRALEVDDGLVNLGPKYGNRCIDLGKGAEFNRLPLPPSR